MSCPLDDLSSHLWISAPPSGFSRWPAWRRQLWLNRFRRSLHSSLDTFIDSIFLLTPDDRDAVLDGLQAVEDTRYRVCRRLKRPEPKAVRNKGIRQKKAEGATYGELSLEYGLARSTLFEIVHRNSFGADEPNGRAAC